MFEAFKKVCHLLTSRDRKISIVIFIFMFFTGVVEVVGIAFVVPFMMVVANPEGALTHKKIAFVYDLLGFTSIHWFLFAIGIFVLCFLVFGNVLAALTTWATERFSANQEHKIGVRLLSKYLSNPYSFFLINNTSKLAKSVATDIYFVTDRILRMGLELFSLIMVVSLMLALLVYVDPVLALTVSVVLGGAYACIYMMARPALMRLGLSQTELSMTRAKALNECLNGIKDIKLLGAEEVMLPLFSKPSLQYLRSRALLIVIEMVPRYFLESIAFGGIVLIVLYLLAVRHSFAQAVPVLALYAFAGYRLMPILQRIYRCIVLIRMNTPKLDILYDSLMKKSEAPVETESEAPLPFSRDIALTNLSFQYDNTSNMVIDNLNLSIKHNTTIGFVGSTGAGKTTVIDIVLGLLAPTQGDLRVDDVRIDATNIRAWQKNIGYVPQAIFLTDESIARNIAFGVPYNKVDSDRVRYAAKLANLDEFVTDLPEQYETVVGERGVRLSGGQRQRIGIARALYRDPQLLILDEATSALDNTTEENILRAIHSLSEQKTIVMIAHRLSTIKACDIIYVMDKGRVVGQGSYEELLEVNPVFQRLAARGAEESPVN